MPRFEYEIAINVMRSTVPAPAPFQALDELAAVLGFGSDHKGAWDSFLIDDPVDGVERRVRFVEDSFAVTKLAGMIPQILLLADLGEVTHEAHLARPL